MKRILAVLFLCLLLTACGGPAEPTAAPAGTTAAPGPGLVGDWVNAGQYSEGHDFVETLTLSPDGTARVHLEYRGSDYATLEGSWTEAAGVLTVDFTDPNTRDRVYAYTVTETTLTLTGDGKAVEYTRK